MSEQPPTRPDPDQPPAGSDPDQRPVEPDPDQPLRSGLRNPAAAVRGVGAGAYAVEAVVLLLAIQPMRVLGIPLTGLAIGVIVAIALLCVVLAGLLRRPWAWYGGPAIQVILFASGFVFHSSLSVIAVVFGLVWAYVLHVRRTVLR